MTQKLVDDLQRQLQDIRRRVDSNDFYTDELDYFRNADEHVHVLREQLGLGEYVGSLSLGRGKPQAILEFDGSLALGETGPVVLKVYGYSIRGEGRLQYQWTAEGRPCVPTLAFGDNPVSWLLMTKMDGHDLSDENLQRNLPRLVERTRQLGAVMAKLHLASDPALLEGRSLISGPDNALGHLEKMVHVLTAHDYTAPTGWYDHARDSYMSGHIVALHGDLYETNCRSDARGELLVYDTIASVGNSAFDAARWTARMAEPDSMESVLDAWIDGAGSFDKSYALKLTESLPGVQATECLMYAGVVEILKEERGQPWEVRDPITLRLLDAYESSNR